MSWTDVFPVMDDTMVADFEAGATPEEKSQLEEWFGVRRVLNRRETPHVVSTSLFWKHVDAKDGELPELDRETLVNAKELGLVKRMEPWKHYVEPLLAGAKHLSATRPEASFRVYLAADLEFLVEELVEAGCEVRLMKSGSIRHNPGAMWRFLALSGRRRPVPVVDSDRGPLAELEIGRTEAMARAGLNFWRVPVFGDYDKAGRMGYRPILACQFGSAQALPMAKLLKAHVWHRLRGTMPLTCRMPGCGEPEMTGTKWPDYGYDEWFLLCAVYPRIARRGVLTFVPVSAKSRMLPLDIEYVTWANPRSESVHFGVDGKCCAPNGTPNTSPKDCLLDISAFEVLDNKVLAKKVRLPRWANRVKVADMVSNGTVSAWFNPAVCSIKGRRFLAYRTEATPTHRWSRVWLVELDSGNRPRPGTNRMLNLKTSYWHWGAEDPRFIVWGERLLLSYTDGTRMGLAELNSEGEVTTSVILSLPKGERFAVAHDGREKNWVFFTRRDKLFVSYWVQPHVVFSVNPETFSLREEMWESEWNRPAAAVLHGGSTPVFHQGLMWRIVHHHEPFAPGRNRYFLWLQAFEPKPPFVVRLFSRRPILCGAAGGDRDATDHQVVFCGSLERAGSGWRVFFGENDRRIRYGRIPDSLVSQEMEEV